MKVQLDYLSKSAAVLILMLAAVSGMAQNLLKNAGFEEQSAKTKFPAFWMKSGAYKGNVSLLTGSSEAHSGNCALKIGSTGGEAAVYSAPDLRFKKDRKVTASVWVKGEGKFLIYYYLYSRKSFLGSVKTEVADVKTDQWKKYEFTSVIPADFGAAKEVVATSKLAFHVRKGTLAFDDVELKVVSEAQKK